MKTIEYMDAKKKSSGPFWMLSDLGTELGVTLSQATIRNGFKELGLIPRHIPMEVYDDDENIRLSQWIQKLNSTKKGAFQKYPIDGYVTADDDVLTTQIPTYEDIISVVAHSHADDNEAKAKMKTSLLLSRSVSLIGAKEGLKKLTQFSETDSNASDEIVEYLNKLQNCFNNNSYKIIIRTKLNDFLRLIELCVIKFGRFLLEGRIKKTNTVG